MLEEHLNVGNASLLVRRARRDDLPAIVALLSDDVLGRGREASNGTLERYERAFEMIEEHPNQELVVVERDNEIVATFDLAILSSLSRQGSVRMQVEAVRVASDARGGGLGGAIFAWIIDYARRRGCDLLQLTSDRTRTGAHAFYDRLGFVGSHVGYKLDLQSHASTD